LQANKINGCAGWQEGASRDAPDTETGLTNRSGLFAAAFLAAVALAASCQSTLDKAGPFDNAKSLPALSPNPNGETVGTGTVRIALLLPRTSAGNAAAVSNELRNGALLAMTDTGQGAIQLVIKDTGGQTAGAQAAANEAVLEGAVAVLGPVFASDVSAASAITAPAGRTMLAFSTDASVARRGIYLLSYLPQDDTQRIIDFAVSQGKRSFLAFLPNNAEGQLREAALRQSAGAAGANATILRYDRNPQSLDKIVADATPLLGGVDSLYIPEGNEIPNVILQGFRRKGVKTFGKLVIGSGAWETVKIGEVVLEGAIYPGRDLANFAAFQSRYEATYGARPGVWAGIGYDAVTLAANLARGGNPLETFRPEIIENPRGYAGVNGVFRLRANGTAERGLAVYQVRNGKAEVISPAPATFSRTGS
jgi:ABC-type branched-subunit amino acid transport system substrate-binding protein